MLIVLIGVGLWIWTGKAAARAERKRGISWWGVRNGWRYTRDSVHFAAGLALCRAAGCIVTDLRGQPLHTGPGLIAAADARTHALLLEIVARHLPTA